MEGTRGRADMTKTNDLSWEGESELTDDEWLSVLSRDYPPSSETIMMICKLRKSRTLRIKKGSHPLSGFGGIGFAVGDEVEIIPKESGGNKVELPDQVLGQLGLQPNDYVCITRKGGKLCLKRLDFLERPTKIPGSLIVDRFGKTSVKRTYSINTDLDGLTYSQLDRLVAKMGKFRYDPIAPFKEIEGRIGFLARKELMGNFTTDDLREIREYKKEIADGQLENGSWDDNTARTAFNLIRLLEVGGTVEDPTVQHAAKWLLSTTEPAGLPGLFMYSEDLVERFNRWKTKPGAKGRQYRNANKGEIEDFYDNSDVLPNISGPPCELRLTWTSALAVEALLRCGLWNERRVVRAINTLASLSRMSGEWCGCGYHDAKVTAAENADDVDFNLPKAIPKENEKHHIDWFVTPEHVRNIADIHGYESLEIGPEEALVVKRYKTTGECVLVVHRALSFHPKYHRSNLEAYAALRCAWRQNSHGTWGDAYMSSMFGFLERFAHPLSAFLVLRSLPHLIREQREDGFWQDRQQDLADLPQWNAPPTKEEGTLMILKALKRFNFLQPLLPY